MSPATSPTPPRRRAGTRHAAAAALAAAALLVATACSGAGTTGRGKGPATAFQLTDRTPAPAGDVDSFTWSVYAEPTTVDYAHAYDFPPNQILANVCESLLRWNPDLTTSPNLATSYTNPTPTTWVYQIRPGVRFHDGTTLTADDVVASLRRHLDPKTASVWANPFRNVKTVDRTGPLEVTVTLTQPDSTFNKYLAAGPGTVESAATLAKSGADYGNPQTGVNCTGPFSFGSWASGQSLTLKRFDDYWNPALKARSGQVKFVFLPDATTRVNAFRSGEVDGGWMVPPDAYAQLRDTGAGKLYFGRNTTVADEVVSNLGGPLGDARVRQALLMAIDREGILKAGVGGVGEVAHSLVTDNLWSDAPAATREAIQRDVPRYPYDPAKAKALAAEAGVNGQKIVIATSPLDSQTTIITQAVAQAATAIGLKPQIDSVSPEKYTTLFTDPAAREGVDLFLTFWNTSITDPLDMYGVLRTDAFSNYGGWSDPAFDAAVDRAVASHDPVERTNANAEAQRIALRELPWLPLYTQPVSVFLGSRITGVQPSIAYLYYPWAAEIGAGG
ncbi:MULTISPECIES: ABC transporter substrate-binding protein [Streptomyces]|uniref:Peptide ABC transporter substrate-binding protein n=1 Tax=Streptomyces virginiae TaxID=1961 RepID=A0ABQ3NMG1_STRVG|nr:MULTISPECIES: ABC transporter substrate-binding protein [Streptomyces]KOU94051.1 peptide ABC transporter substrate-binding protein [Streptomyces sp. XY533]MBP2342156.1 peptide/nickel transport system substrate-binding protein [Streptomyces virginiae]GGQ22348.1 peptide ABC transporter substrate-binding protein [Streptomyces virginiae]GHI13959.1 peptide ABC transporter substrate-binding protein [Streptomyces virginiae]GLV94313.1 peptide ABC transporter substrate-binding protein [Streptomyces 